MPWNFLGDGVAGAAAGLQGIAGLGGQQQAAMGQQAAAGFNDIRVGARPRILCDVEAIHDFASNWLIDGLELSTIVVPYSTFEILYLRIINKCHHGAYQRSNLIPKELTISTVLGPVKIIYESNSFNLEKYMETVE